MRTPQPNIFYYYTKNRINSQDKIALLILYINLISNEKFLKKNAAKCLGLLWKYISYCDKINKKGGLLWLR
jgi:hypothetical protein